MGSRRRKYRNKKNRPLLGKLLFGVYLLAAVGLVLSYFSPFVSPNTFWPLSFFGLAYPVFLLINLLFAIFWLLRWEKKCWIPFLLLLAGIPLHRQNVGFRFSGSKPRPEQGARVMTYNTHSFTRYGKGFNEETKSQMLELIRRESPDILAIQEFYTRSEGPFDIRDSLQHIMDSPYYYIENTTANDFETHGMAIFSRYPIRHKERVNIAGNRSFNICTFADIEINGAMVRLFNVHLQSIQFEKEDYEYLSGVKGKLKTDMSSSRRIGSRLKRAFMLRASQANIVASMIKESPYPVIICGDFNDTPMSYAYQTILSSGLKSTFAEKGSGYAITYGGAFPNYQIDHILCNEEDFDVLNYRIIKKKLSDHYPVRSDLVLKNQEPSLPDDRQATKSRD